MPDCATVNVELYSPPPPALPHTLTPSLPLTTLIRSPPPHSPPFPPHPPDTVVRQCIRRRRSDCFLHLQHAGKTCAREFSAPITWAAGMIRAEGDDSLPFLRGAAQSLPPGTGPPPSSQTAASGKSASSPGPAIARVSSLSLLPFFKASGLRSKHASTTTCAANFTTGRGMTSEPPCWEKDCLIKRHFDQ